ncbi:MAG: FG-GAP-like repeat-containing protein [Acidobacteria bacterium]|nr:FG-GAP-like repeat-containing protein [Acidobacteriota bacterium]
MADVPMKWAGIWLLAFVAVFGQSGEMPMRLLRAGKTAEARVELLRLQRLHPGDVEIQHQIARSYLLDFYKLTDVEQRKTALALAMEGLASTLKTNPNHIPALRAKAIIHARAELLYYDPNLAYELGARVAKLEPHANAYILSLTEWMSGEVRFTEHSGHRVPHDPLLGLDRSITLLEHVIDNAMPFSGEETAAYFSMGKTLSRRGSFKESLLYFEQAIVRTQNLDQKVEALREAGTSYYRMGEYNDAGRMFYEALQLRPSDQDRWMLKVALDQLGAAAPVLQKSLVFPAANTKPGPGVNLRFEDMAPALGVDRFDGNGTCAWGDLDGDGDYDLILAGSGTFLAVYRNDGGKFTEVTGEVGLAGVPSGYSLNLVDYDNDGKLDLYVSLNGWSGPLKNKLFRNVGGKFVDVSAASGADDGGDGFVSLWGDLDNDGFLDLVIANGVLKDGSVPQIYRNKGDGTFENVTKAAGLNEPAQYGAIGIALGDYDKDGDLDILVNGLDSAPNRLYRNDGKWKFTEVARQAGILQPPHNGFVCFFVDYNNDGYPDILTTSLAAWPAVIEGLKAGYAPSSARAMHPDTNRLFENNRDGTFRDVTFKAKLYFPMGTMGAGVADLDNDGFVDFYFGTGDPQLTRMEPNRFFRNNGEGTFSDASAAGGFARPGNKGHGVGFVDIDDDGDWDLYAQLGGHYPGDMARNAFYRNLEGNKKNWLEIDLTGVQSNRFGVGAQVTAKAGGMTVYREVKGSEGFGSTDPYRVHMGLGGATVIDELEIRWPSGVKQKWEGVKVNQRMAVREAAQ